ncbi:hypothetical protein Dimus_028502 [Dionaea muscipula]
MPMKRKSIPKDIELSPKVQKETPMRSIRILNKMTDMEKFDKLEDCFILGFDPSGTNIDLSKSKDSNLCNDQDLCFLGEKGKVACRDYAHARYLCSKYPFATTAHERCCELCYCYVCDRAAPCKEWKNHCSATHKCGIWKSLRSQRRKIRA